MRQGHAGVRLLRHLLPRPEIAGVGIMIVRTTLMHVWQKQSAVIPTSGWRHHPDWGGSIT